MIWPNLCERPLIFDKVFAEFWRTEVGDWRKRVRDVAVFQSLVLGGRYQKWDSSWRYSLWRYNELLPRLTATSPLKRLGKWLGKRVRTAALNEGKRKKKLVQPQFRMSSMNAAVWSTSCSTKRLASHSWQLGNASTRFDVCPPILIWNIFFICALSHIDLPNRKGSSLYERNDF